MTAKPLRLKDRAALEHWLETGNLTDAYRLHVARDPCALGAQQNSHAWARQPHIKAAADAARQAVIELQFGDARALVLEQAKRLDRIYQEGMAIRTDHNGNSAPTSLQAALGATISMSKLFGESTLSGMTKLKMLQLWTSIQGELRLPAAAKLQIEQAIVAGEAI